ncbi:MAG: flagellar basal body rod protein FlgC, partial [Firmicutes bacterium HGW-Firmicutes-6]
MSFLSSFNITGSGLTAQRLRMDVISENIANAQVTRTESGAPYRRKMVVLKSVDSEGASFSSAFKEATARGVQVDRIVEDSSELVPTYNPAHPDAIEEGYVMYPNVNTAQEMIDMLGASRA